MQAPQQLGVDVLVFGEAFLVHQGVDQDRGDVREVDHELPADLELERVPLLDDLVDVLVDPLEHPVDLLVVGPDLPDADLGQDEDLLDVLHLVLQWHLGLLTEDGQDAGHQGVDADRGSGQVG